LVLNKHAKGSCRYDASLLCKAESESAALGPFLGHLMAGLWGTGSMYWGEAASVQQAFGGCQDSEKRRQ